MKKDREIVIQAGKICTDESERFDKDGFKKKTKYMVEVEGVLHPLPRIYTAYCELIGMLQTKVSNHGKGTVSYKLFDELDFDIVVL